MPFVRISELTDASSLTGTEELEVSQGGNSRKATTQDIANLASGGASLVTESITSGASPVAASVSADITHITTGGTAGDEYVTIADLPYGPSGYSDPDKIGKRHIFVLSTRSNPADVVKVTADYAIKIVDNYGNILASASEFVLDFEQGFFALEWDGQSWRGDNRSFNSDTVFIDVAGPVPPVSNTDGMDGYLGAYNNGSPTWSVAPFPGTLQFPSTGASPLDLFTVSQWATGVRTGGTAGTESITLSNPTLRFCGSRRVIFIETLTDPADVVSVDTTYIKDAGGGAVASITMDAVEEYLLLEAYDDDFWRIVRTTATVT